MKCQILFSGQNNKKYFNMSSADFFTRMLSVNNVQNDKSPAMLD